MEKAEFLNLISQHWDDISNLRDSESLYDLEKDFDQIWVKLGNQVLEGTVSDVPDNRRKKKSSKVGMVKLK